MRRLIDRARKKDVETRDEAGHEGWLSLPDSKKDDPVVKPAAYLPIYEQLLFPLREQPFTLLELGVWSGASLEMWRDSFPRATIVGIDLGPPELESRRPCARYSWRPD